MNGKVWYRSRTLWLNTVVIVIAVVGVLEKAPVAGDVRVQTTFSVASAVLNIVLRILTNQPVTLTPTPTPEKT